MTWRTEIFGSGYWADRGFVFDTKAEALSYGLSLTRFTRQAYRAIPTEGPANYRYQAGNLIPLRHPVQADWAVFP